MTKRDTAPSRARQLRARLGILAAVLCVSALGCELALDFDRTLIDGGSVDASFGDTDLGSDTGNDTGTVTDGATTDGGSDAVAADTGTDSATKTDTGSDASTGDASDGAIDDAAADADGE